MFHKITNEDVTLTLSHDEFNILHDMIYLKGQSHLYDIGEKHGIKDFDDPIEGEKFDAIPEVKLGTEIIYTLHYRVWGALKLINTKKVELTEEDVEDMEEMVDELFGLTKRSKDN